MFYPEMSPFSLFEHFKSELQWSSPLQVPSKVPFRADLNIPIIQIFNPLQAAWINLISVNQHDYLSSTIAEKIIATEGALVFDQHIITDRPDMLKRIKSLKVKNCFITPESIEKIFPILNVYLHQKLAARSTYHGTLVEVFGHGVLFMGPSGIGKSRAALYCLERKHTLIADDASHLFRFGNQIIGECPNNLEGLLEIRQLGIIQVNQQFGLASTKKQYVLDLIVELNNNTDMERTISPNFEYENILGVNIPKIRLAFSQDIAILAEHAIRLLSNQPT